MRKIKMKSTAAGPMGSFQVGNEYQVPDEIAGLFVEAGAAEYMDGGRKTADRPGTGDGRPVTEPVIETAVEPVETTFPTFGAFVLERIN